MEKKKVPLDTPLLQLPWSKPVRKGLWTRMKSRIFGERYLARLTFVYRTYLKGGTQNILILAAAGFMFAGYFHAIPVVHTYRIRNAYERRHERHLKYLEENPDYEKALLHAYKNIGPS